jgi:HAE1 family hydrophobic/amphiphilic exporter-1
MLGYRLIRVKESFISGRIWNTISGFYKKILNWCLNNRWTTIGIALLIFIASLATIRFVEIELLPAADEGRFELNLEYPVGTALDITQKAACRIDSFLSQYPEVESVFSTIGQSGAFAEKVPYKAEMIVQLVPQNKRDSLEDVIEKIRDELPDLPGANIQLLKPSLSSNVSGAAVDVRIRGDNLDTLKNLGEKAVDAIQDIPGLVNLNSSLSAGNPEIQVDIDREKIADLGVSTSDIATTLRTAISGTDATKWSRNGREYDIMVRFPENSRSSISDVSNLLINTRNGNIPLHQIAHISYGVGPIAIDHTEQIRNVILTADTSGRSRREVLSEVRDKLSELEIPAGYEIVYEGQSRAIRESFTSMTIALIIAVFLVYVVMGVQFNSFIYPLIIMFSLPLAFIGVFFGLFISRSSISLNSFLGMLVLAGIVVNDSIVLIDYINTLRKRGMDRLEAILQAGPIRLRPILMTSFTTIFGLLPIALGIGEGAETLAPLGISVIGGLITSTFLTLVVIPCFYTIIDDISRRKFRKTEEAES